MLTIRKTKNGKTQEMTTEVPLHHVQTYARTVVNARIYDEVSIFDMEGGTLDSYSIKPLAK